MVYTNIDSLNLGKLVQIVFSKGVLYQGSEDTREWEQVLSMKASDPMGRETRYLLQKHLGYAAAGQYRNPGTKNRTFPQSQQGSFDEFTAKLKEINTTLELEYQMWERAQTAKSAKYLEPLAIEAASKATAQKRLMCFDFYEDGSGVRGTGASIVETGIAAGRVVVTLNVAEGKQGHTGGFQEGDIMVLKRATGAARDCSLSGGSQPYGWKVVDRDFDLDTVTFDLIDSTETAVVNVTATNLTAGDVFYRVGQPTYANLASVSDWGYATECITGLESLGAADGRTVNGIAMTGTYKGSQYDAGTDPLDAIMFDKALARGKKRVGQGRYKYAKACMADEAHTQLIDSREGDRRFIQVTDNKRGTSFFAYQHRNDTVEAYTSEFIRKNRIWILPELKGGDKVLQFHGDDFKAVKGPGGQEFMLKPASGGGHTNDIVSYMRGLGQLVCKHPAALVSIKNFTITV